MILAVARLSGNAGKPMPRVPDRASSPAVHGPSAAAAARPGAPAAPLRTLGAASLAGSGGEGEGSSLFGRCPAPRDCSRNASPARDSKMPEYF